MTEFRGRPLFIFSIDVAITKARNVVYFSTDGFVDLLDYAGLFGCLTGPQAPSAIECACHDLNADGHVDLRDHGLASSTFNRR